MNRNRASIAACLILGVLCSIDATAVDKPTVPVPQAHEGQPDGANGVIGISLHIGADRVGEPAVLYVAMVHPEGPAREAGLAHGDEITTVDGTAVSGKSYEQIVKMIRGTAGTAVKLGVKGETGMREVSVPRVPSEDLSQGPTGSYRRPSP